MDLIEREQAMNIFAVDLAEKDKQVSYQGFCIDAVIVIGSLPSAEKTGRWKRINYADEVNGYVIPNYECSNCENWVRDMTDYCPNCGAKMVIENESL